MTGDCHVRFSERPGAKLPRATHLNAHAGICAGGAWRRASLPRPRSEPAVVSAFIDQTRARYGVEPISRTLGVSAAAYYQRATGERSPRRLEDERLARIREVHEQNFECYGYPPCGTSCSARASRWAVTESRG
jgi:hypothetical protein